jgi:hypothetical protein
MTEAQPAVAVQDSVQSARLGIEPGLADVTPLSAGAGALALTCATGVGYSEQSNIWMCSFADRVISRLAFHIIYSPVNQLHIAFDVTQQPKSGLGRLLFEVSRSHSDTHHSR